MEIVRFNTPKLRSVMTVLCLLIIMAAGLFVRLDDIREWQTRPGQAFLHGEPLLTTFDGYFYLNLSRDLLTDTYTPVDEKQVVPEGRKRPFPPPLLAVLGAWGVKISGLSLNWIGTVLPPVLGVLLALPLFFLGRYFGGAVMGGTAAISGLLFPYYIYRSNAGWFDTDCLNVTFATASIYFFLKFVRGSGLRRYWYFGAGCFIYLLFLWWWDQAPVVVSVICLSNLAVALFFFHRPSKKEAYYFYGILLAIGTIFFLWHGWAIPKQIYHTITSLFDYIYTSKNVAGVFPSASITVSEQVRPGFDEIVTKSTGSMAVFIAACVGLISLFLRRPKDSLFLLVPLGMASLSFFFAKRFLIFLNPITALGLGAFVAFIWHCRKRYKIAAPLTPVVLGLLIWPTLSSDLATTHWPKEPGAIVAGMAAAGEHTPENAIIWTWWDHGYNMRYWADRGVIADGSYHGGNISLYNALPLTLHNDRLSANFMQFYAARGSKGMERIYGLFSGDHANALTFLQKTLAVGPEDAPKIIQDFAVEQAPGKYMLDDPELLDFLFPPDPKPIYLFLDWRLTITSYWWYWFGSWDFAKKDGIHPVFDLTTAVSVKEGQIAGRNRRGTLSADMRTGSLNIGESNVPLADISFYDLDGTAKKASYGKKGLSLEVSGPNRVAALVDSSMAESVFNRLYIRQQYDKRYFRQVLQDFPAWQLWEVSGDSR